MLIGSTFSLWRLVLTRHTHHAALCNRINIHQREWLVNATLRLFSEDSVDSQKPTKKPKRPPVPKITLLSATDDNISVTTLEEAQYLSKRRDLKLVKITDLDSKTQRPVYKLMTGAEYNAEELKQRLQHKLEKQQTGFKGEKILILKSVINQHDLDVNIKKILKWISKNYEVRITINGNLTNMEQSETLYKLVEVALKGQCRFLQKRIKGSDLKFQIVPPKNNDKDPNNL